MEASATNHDARMAAIFPFHRINLTRPFFCGCTSSLLKVLFGPRLPRGRWLALSPYRKLARGIPSPCALLSLASTDHARLRVSEPWVRFWMSLAVEMIPVDHIRRRRLLEEKSCRRGADKAAGNWDGGQVCVAHGPVFGVVSGLGRCGMATARVATCRNRNPAIAKPAAATTTPHFCHCTFHFSLFIPARATDKKRQATWIPAIANNAWACSCLPPCPFESSRCCPRDVTAFCSKCRSFRQTIERCKLCSTRLHCLSVHVVLSHTRNPSPTPSLPPGSQTSSDLPSCVRASSAISPTLPSPLP